MLGSPPPPWPRLQGVPPSLPLGVTVSSGSALAGWVTSDKPLEGNCLQHGLGLLAQLSRGLPGPGAAASLPGPSLARPAHSQGWEGPGLSWRQLWDCSLQTPPWDAKSIGPAHSAPKPVQPVVWEEGAPGRSCGRCQKQPP